MEDNNSLMNKRVDDLTVGDALKINGVVLAVMVGVPALTFGAMAAKDVVVRKFKQVREHRKNKTEE